MTEKRSSSILGIVLAAALTACAGADDGAEASAGTATTIGSADDAFTVADIEAGRMDSSWRRYASRGSATAGTSSVADIARAEDSASAARPVSADPRPRAPRGAATDTAIDRWSEISPRTVNDGNVQTPLHGDVSGPSVVRVQTLLDRTSFSPGIIDGRWGKNTEKAVHWFQYANGIEATGQVDRATLERLVREAGAPSQVIIEHALSEEDVSGPFLQLPSDVYERAEMECMCYESLSEQLAERFHSTPALLRQLNPNVDLDAVSAGDRLSVPAVRDVPEGQRGEVARIAISDGGHYLHALDADGNILYHFPSTLGSDYAPSPTGDYSIESIHPDPTWHYQPSLLTGVPDDQPDAVLPPGPNNAVGVVWMQLSKPHYGIHGTKAPETIGYVTSHGCVRLTNWDASFLAGRLSPGTPVEFRDAS